MRKWVWAALWVAVGIVLPIVSQAQVLDQAAGELKGLHKILETIYEQMLPLCGELIGVGRGLAGFASLWYIASRVWKHLAAAEPIDFYPLLRPFALGFCILMFPSVIAMINGVMKPTVTATSEMVDNSNEAIASLLQQKEDALKETDKWQMFVGPDERGNRDKWLKYTQGLDDKAPVPSEGMFESIGNDIRFAMDKARYNFSNSIKEWMSEVLRVLFEAAALCIDTLRTFQLVVLAIVGPLVFGLATFDGFQHTLTVWLARYINVFLWLPVANIFSRIIGQIQQEMIKLDLDQIQQSGDTVFSATDIGYLVFLLIGIVGYFTVPSVANYIVHAAGGGALQQKITNGFSSFTGAAAGAAAGGIIAADKAASNAGSMLVDSMGDAAGNMYRSMDERGTSSGYFNDQSNVDS